jgi:hypothetical protein
MPNSTALLEFTVYCFGYITYDQTSVLAEDSTMVPLNILVLEHSHLIFKEHLYNCVISVCINYIVYSTTCQ